MNKWKKVSQSAWEYGTALRYRIQLNGAGEWTVTRGIGDQQHLFCITLDKLERVKAACMADYATLRKQIDSFEDDIILKKE